ncbi:MAG: DoxX family membrane protein [Acidimicrobiales bacterium]|nr:DoxX family membrane protein [Acidimicrobiales bacterium]
MATVSALFLAAVLWVAGVAKLVDRKRTVDGFGDLGLPAPQLLGWIVPVLELAVGALLIASPGWGGVAAFGMLASFTVVLVVTIRSGRLVPCRCFGGTSDDPVTWGQVARNGWLLCHAVIASLGSTLQRPSLVEIVVAAATIAVGPIAISWVEKRFTVTV